MGIPEYLIIYEPCGMPPKKNTAIPANKRGALFNYCPCDRTNFSLIITLIQAKVKPRHKVYRPH